MSSVPKGSPPAGGGAPKALVAGVVVAVVVLVVVLVLALTRPSEEGAPAAGATGGEQQPGVSVGGQAAAAAPAVVVYEDFQCPWCAIFDQAVGEELHTLADEGEIQLTYVLRNFLDGQADTSTRAANAALCAEEAEAFLPFHELLFARHPVHQGAQGHETGWTDEDFVAVAEEAGVSGAGLEDFRRCVADLEHQSRVEAMEQRSAQDGVSGTPTVLVDGEPLGDQVMNGLLTGAVSVEQAITEATS